MSSRRNRSHGSSPSPSPTPIPSPTLAERDNKQAVHNHVRHRRQRDGDDGFEFQRQRHQRRSSPLAPTLRASTSSGRGGRGGSSSLPSISGERKAEIWKKMIEFQQDAEATRLLFPATYSSEERKYVHKIAINLSMDTKSHGKAPNRYCQVVKGGKRGKRSEQSERNDGLRYLYTAPLTTRARTLIDAFLQQNPISKIEAFDPMQSVRLTCSSTTASTQSRSYFSSVWKPPPPSVNRQAYLSSLKYQQMLAARQKLPIYTQRQAILDLWDQHQVMVISGATGCGKSTQCPQFILEHLDALATQRSSRTSALSPEQRERDAKRLPYTDGEIICTQPRRISAISLAERVADERGENPGESIGYQIRLEKQRSSDTRVLFCTVGILLRRLTSNNTIPTTKSSPSPASASPSVVSDRALPGVSCLIIDEAHERERNCDFLLTIVRDLLPKRPDLRVILMSATLNSDLFVEFFSHLPSSKTNLPLVDAKTGAISLLSPPPLSIPRCPHLFCPGFTFPVQTFHLADVLELTGYDIYGSAYASTTGSARNNSVNTSIARARRKCVETRLATELERLISHQLFDANAEDATLLQNDFMPATAFSPFSTAVAKPLSHPPPPTVVAKNLPIGWTDTYVYQPSFEIEAMLNAAGIAGEEEKDASDPTLPLTVDVSNSFSTAPRAHPPSERFAQVNIQHSESTIKMIEKIEAEGMDYIDYSLIVEVLSFICTKFSTDHRTNSAPSSSSPASASVNRTKARGRGGPEVVKKSFDINVENGSILVFLPGWEDINTVIAEMNAHPHFSKHSSFASSSSCSSRGGRGGGGGSMDSSIKYLVLPLHGSIASAEQRRIFTPSSPEQRKIILSTNIAETSITIDDVIFVIDTGKMKEKIYDPHCKMSSLQSTWISRANAQQRSGRAGRSRPGVCFRLYSERMYAQTLPEFPTPELLRTPLEEVCLQIKLLHISDESISEFLQRCIEPPSTVAVDSAILLLKNLGALTLEREDLTILGEYLAALPLDPRLGRMILYAAAFQCLDPILTIAACLSYRDPFLLPRTEARAEAAERKQKLAADQECDLLLLLNAFTGYERALKEGGVNSAFSYCRYFYLQQSTMSMITDMKNQLLQVLMEVGLIEDVDTPQKTRDSHVKRGTRWPSNANAFITQRHYNAFSNDLLLVHAVCAAGLYPNAAKVSYALGKKRVPELTTRDGLTRLRVHPSSVNAGGKRLDPMNMRISGSSPFDAEVEEQANGGRRVRESSSSIAVAPWLMYNEIMRSTDIFVRTTSIATPLTLALLVGDRGASISNSYNPTSSTISSSLESGALAHSSTQPRKRASMQVSSSPSASPPPVEVKLLGHSMKELVTGTKKIVLKQNDKAEAACLTSDDDDRQQCRDEVDNEDDGEDEIYLDRMCIDSNSSAAASSSPNLEQPPEDLQVLLDRLTADNFHQMSNQRSRGGADRECGGFDAEDEDDDADESEDLDEDDRLAREMALNDLKKMGFDDFMDEEDVDDEQEEDELEAPEEDLENKEGSSLFIGSRQTAKALKKQQRSVALTRKKISSHLSSSTALLVVDDFIRFDTSRKDYSRIQSIHRYLAWLIYKRILHSKTSSFSDEELADNVDRIGAEKIRDEGNIAEEQTEAEILSLFAEILHCEAEALGRAKSKRERRLDENTAEAKANPLALPASTMTASADRSGDRDTSRWADPSKSQYRYNSSDELRPSAASRNANEGTVGSRGGRFAQRSIRMITPSPAASALQPTPDIAKSKEYQHIQLNSLQGVSEANASLPPTGAPVIHASHPIQSQHYAHMPHLHFQVDSSNTVFAPNQNHLHSSSQWRQQSSSYSQNSPQLKHAALQHSSPSAFEPQRVVQMHVDRADAPLLAEPQHNHGRNHHHRRGRGRRRSRGHD